MNLPNEMKLALGNVTVSPAVPKPVRTYVSLYCFISSANRIPFSIYIPALNCSDAYGTIIVTCKLTAQLTSNVQWRKPLSALDSYLPAITPGPKARRYLTYISWVSVALWLCWWRCCRWHSMLVRQTEKQKWNNRRCSFEEPERAMLRNKGRSPSKRRKSLWGWRKGNSRGSHRLKGLPTKKDRNDIVERSHCIDFKTRSLLVAGMGLNFYL